jgi:hypothetical protein
VCVCLLFAYLLMFSVGICNCCCVVCVLLVVRWVVVSVMFVMWCASLCVWGLVVVVRWEVVFCCCAM